MVVLSSAEAVRDVLERQSAATVSRSPNHFDQLAHDGKFLVMAPYCKFFSDSSSTDPISLSANSWRTLRKAANSVLTPQSAIKYVPIQRAESLQLLYDILRAPKVNKIRVFVRPANE
jgi:cytochrome P450